MAQGQRDFVDRKKELLGGTKNEANSRDSKKNCGAEDKGLLLMAFDTHSKQILSFPLFDKIS